MQPSFTSIKPNSHILRKYISYYYFTKDSRASTSYEFIYYPHYRNALTTYKGSERIDTSNRTEIKPCAENNYLVLYSTIKKTPRVVHITAPYDKIGVVFQPLGINHFIDRPLDQLVSPANEYFNYFGDYFIEVLDTIYETSDFNKKVELLDEFFLSKLSEFEDQVLKKAVTAIHHENQKWNVLSLSEELTVNRKTLLRKFQKHLMCSVKHYLDTVKFRKALTNYLDSGSQEKPNLTSLSYQFDYFDQSEFIKHFKKLTGSKPLQLLKEIHRLGKEDTFWSIKD